MEPQPRRVLDIDVVAVPTGHESVMNRGFLCKYCAFGPTKAGGRECAPRRSLSSNVCDDVVFWLVQDYAAYRITGDVPEYITDSKSNHFQND